MAWQARPEYAVLPEEAIARLRVIDYDCGCPDDPGPHVHTYAEAGGMLIGAHWPLSDVLAVINGVGVENAGDAAVEMGHSLVFLQEKAGRSYYIWLETEPHSGAA